MPMRRVVRLRRAEGARGDALLELFHTQLQRVDVLARVLRQLSALLGGQDDFDMLFVGHVKLLVGAGFGGDVCQERGDESRAPP